MAAVRCTAPKQGHEPGSQAQRQCPVHGAAAAQPRVSPPPSLSLVPMSTNRPKYTSRAGGISTLEWLDDDDRRHRLDGPALLTYGPLRNVESEIWYVEGRIHRLDGPARILYWPNGTVDMETWYLDGTRVEPWEVLGRYLTTQGVPGVSTEALKQIAKDVPWQRWSELGPDHPLVALWGTVHPSADISAG